MTFVFPDKQFKEIRPGDEHFNMTDGIKLVPRASIQISLDCPEEYRLIIVKAYQQNWIKPIAHVKATELFWELLGD